MRDPRPLLVLVLIAWPGMDVGSTSPRSALVRALQAGETAGTTAPPTAAGWPTYGSDAGGRRYSPARQITPENVADLEVAWTFRTGDLGEGFARADNLTFEIGRAHV